MSSTPNTPGDVNMELAPLPRWVIVLFVIAFGLVGYLFYANYQQHQTFQQSQADGDKKAQALATELEKTNSRLADLKGQLEVTSQKLGLTQDELARARGLAQSIRKDEQKADEQLRQQIGAVQTDATTKIGQVSTQINGAQTDIAATKADLEATKTKLQSTVGDLGVQSGLIARNHDEVEELKRIGERNIYEFTIKRQKAPEHVGPIQVLLRKTDPKHYRYTLSVVADDKSVEKKDKTVGEPIQFYVGGSNGSHAPYEIVVFEMGKDQVKGYLSTPKTAGGPAASNTPPGN
jgi:hypothetical protein